MRVKVTFKAGEQTVRIVEIQVDELKEAIRWANAAIAYGMVATGIGPEIKYETEVLNGREPVKEEEVN